MSGLEHIAKPLNSENSDELRQPFKDDQPRDLLEAACYLVTLEKFLNIMEDIKKIKDAVADNKVFRHHKVEAPNKTEGKQYSCAMEALNSQSHSGDGEATIPYATKPGMNIEIKQHSALNGPLLQAAVIIDAVMMAAAKTAYERFFHSKNNNTSDEIAQAAKLKDIRINLSGYLFAPLKLTLHDETHKPTLALSSQELLHAKIRDLKKFIASQQYEIAQMEYRPGGAENSRDAIDTLIQLYEKKIISISKVQITGDNLPEIFEALLPNNPERLAVLKKKLDPLASLNDHGQGEYLLVAFYNAVNAKLQDLLSDTSPKLLSLEGSEERKKMLRKIAPVVQELQQQDAMKPVLDAFEKGDLTTLRLIAYFKEQKLYAPMVKGKYLLLIAQPKAMLQWLGYPIPENRGRRVIWAVSFLLPHRLFKLIGGGAAYWCGTVHERGLHDNHEVGLFWAGCTGLFLLLRAIFLPVKSWRAAANYSRKGYIRYPLTLLSGLLTVVSWSVASAWVLPAALPFIIQGLGLISSSAAAAVASFLAGVASYFGSWLATAIGVGTLQAASAATGGAMALALAIFRASRSLMQLFRTWLGTKISDIKFVRAKNHSFAQPLPPEGKALVTSPALPKQTESEGSSSAPIANVSAPLVPSSASSMPALAADTRGEAESEASLTPKVVTPLTTPEPSPGNISSWQEVHVTAYSPYTVSKTKVPRGMSFFAPSENEPIKYSETTTYTLPDFSTAAPGEQQPNEVEATDEQLLQVSP